MASYFRGLPDELIESARIDGARIDQVFVRVAVPLARPAVVTVLLINVFVQWSELVLALVLLPDADKQTATVAIATFSTQFRTGGPLTAAGIIIVSAPIFVLFLLGQRSLRTGLLAGGLKA
jgi:ABC-type glycerol-3-phosphate transport system permease component